MIEEKDHALALKYLKRSINFNETESQSALKFVQIFGCATYKSDFEADKLLSFLSNSFKDSLVLSNDSDCLAHGVNNLLRSSNGLEDKIEIIHLEELLRILSVSRENFVQFCVLMGTDYNENIKRVGPVTLFQIIKNLEAGETVFDKVKRKMELTDETFLREVCDYFLSESAGEFERFEPITDSNEAELKEFFEENGRGLSLVKKESIFKNLREVLAIRARRNK